MQIIFAFAISILISNGLPPAAMAGKTEFTVVVQDYKSLPPYSTYQSGKGVVTLSAISLISAIDQQAKSLTSLASAFAVVGNLRSI